MAVPCESLQIGQPPAHMMPQASAADLRPQTLPRRGGALPCRWGALPLLAAALVLLLVVGASPFPPRATPALAAGAVPTPDTVDLRLGEVLRDAGAKAFRSGWAGFAAGMCQVLLFMWLRTTMNYQYANGGGFLEVLGRLWREGGVRRLYQGLFPWAIIQAPLTRFGATAANRLVLAVTGVYLPSVPVAAATLLASAAGACWRIFITPVDTLKTTMQVRGPEAMKVLRSKVKEGGLCVLYAGWQAMWLADLMGNYPWWLANNLLAAHIPKPEVFLHTLARNAFIGVCASCVSDTISNSMRVVKTSRQTAADASAGYAKSVKDVIAADGLRGLFCRGLGTRLITNMLQGAVFSVMWKYLSGED